MGHLARMQTLPKKFKHDQTTPNKVAKQHNVSKQCLKMFGRQTFPVWTGRKAFRKGLEKILSTKSRFGS